MTITGDALANWLPRYLVAHSARSDRDLFEQEFADTFFLLIKLKSYADPLVLGLIAAFNDAEAASERAAGILVTNAHTDEVSNVVHRAKATSDSISTPMALEPRFVVPIRKRLADAERVVTVGRSHRSDIPLREQTVSKHHAHFEIEEQGWYLVDHDSKNHTRLNGDILGSRARLEPGDTICFGRVEAKVCSATALWNRIASA